MNQIYQMNSLEVYGSMEMFDFFFGNLSWFGRTLFVFGMRNGCYSQRLWEPEGDCLFCVSGIARLSLDDSTCIQTFVCHRFK